MVIYFLNNHIIKKQNITRAGYNITVTESLTETIGTSLHFLRI